MLELKNVKKSYDGTQVLTDISLNIGDGEIVSILGPSGCGKTTLLNLILGIVDSDGGQIIYNGVDITDVPMEKRGFNIVFQDYALFPNLNVYQNITYGLRNNPEISSKEEVEELIHLLGLEEHLNKRIGQLSGGQKQRVALARTMVMKPKILLLDEPLSALDGVIKESIKDRIRTIAEQYNLTTIIVTHDPEEALTLSNQVMIINDGKIAQFGKPEEIIGKPENGFVKKFILKNRHRCAEEVGTMRKNREIKLIFAIVAVFFAGFLAVPMISVLIKSFTGNGEAASLSHYIEVLTGRGFLRALGNSFAISICSALLATVLAFILAYTIHYTNVGKRYKWLISKAAILPMLLPTITYGFAIIYSFGKQGLLTKLFGRQLFDIYGFNGLLLGYVVYTLPVAFTLINNAMGYIDKRFMIVSRLMGDSPLQTFRMTIVIPLLGTLATSFIQTFFLCFTDFGIPASVGGQYEVVASVLYAEMLGSIPNFGNGAVVALIMIIPSVVSITVLHILEKYNVRYNKISPIELKKGVKRDVVFSVLSGAILICALSMFIVMFITPFIEEWPYRMNFTLEHVQAVFEDRQLYGVYVNSVMVALVTALVGTLIAYGGALVTARSTVSGKLKKVIDSIALVTNTIPGMVIGLAYLFVFTGTPLQNTFPIIIICNIVHYFSTPYLMMKNSLSKMNASWETTAMLMGDNWMKTIVRVVTPNALSTLLEVFSYYFVNAMVTVSAVIFIAGARTMVITTKIQELQYFNEFNEIFVLSLLILLTNLIARAVFRRLAKMSESRQNTAKIYRFEKRKAA